MAPSAPVPGPNALPPTIASRKSSSAEPLSTTPTALAGNVLRDTRAHLPLVIGGGIALCAVLAGFAVAFIRRDNPGTSAPGSIASPVTVAPLVPPSDAMRVVAIPQPMPVDDAAVAPSQAPVEPGDPFEAARANLADPIRACGNGDFHGRHIAARITWNADGFPLSVAIDHPVNAGVRSCISHAVAGFGRVDAHGARPTSRRFSFALE